MIINYKILSDDEIDKIIANQGVSKKDVITVENFLMTISTEYDKEVHLSNLELDTKLYQLDSKAYNAIRHGIEMLYAA